VKELLKSDSICESYAQMIFLTHSVYVGSTERRPRVRLTIQQRDGR